VSGRRAPLLAGAAVAVVVILVVMFLVLPKMGEVGEAEKALQAAEDQEVTLQAQLGVLQEAQADAPETEREIAVIEDQVPPTTDLPALFRLLQSAADRAALDFFSFSPGTPVLATTGGHSILAATITVNGGYFAIDEFLFLLETLPRAAKVTSITLAPGGATTDEAGTPTTTTSSLQMTANVEFYTTDTSAGPGSVPGPTETVAPIGA
jgi:Tfp pilus assembly protein PilO